MQDTFRSQTLKLLPFYSQAKVLAFLDQIETIPEDARLSYDPVMMLILSACLLQESFRIS